MLDAGTLDLEWAANSYEDGAIYVYGERHELSQRTHVSPTPCDHTWSLAGKDWSVASPLGVMANQARQLFVVGAARTGTTALCRYLSMHPRVCVLNERYKKMAPDVGPGHFRFSRIRENVEEETNQPADEFEAILSSKRERRLKWVGDKGYGYALSPERGAPPER